MTPAEDSHGQGRDTPLEPGTHSTPSIQQNLADRPPNSLQQSLGATISNSDKPEKEGSRLERIQLRVSIAGVVILLFYTGFTAWLAFLTKQSVHISEQTLRTTEHAQKQHLNPELVCFLGNSSDYQFRVFFLENEGQIDAESVAVDHLTFRYEKSGEKTGQIRFSGFTDESNQLRPPGVRWLYASKLRPTERSITKEIGLFVTPPNTPESKNEIAILFFKVSYLRPTDGYLYEKRCVFYYDGDHYDVPMNFKSNSHFDNMNKELERSLAKIRVWDKRQGPYLLRQVAE